MQWSVGDVGVNQQCWANSSGNPESVADTGASQWRSCMAVITFSWMSCPVGVHVPCHAESLPSVKYKNGVCAA